LNKFENWESKKDTLGIAQFFTKDGKRAKQGDEVSILLSDGTTRLTTITSGRERPFPGCGAASFIALAGAVGEADMENGNFATNSVEFSATNTVCPGDKFDPCAEDLAYPR
jgi:hypothetical protein